MTAAYHTRQNSSMRCRRDNVTYLDRMPLHMAPETGRARYLRECRRVAMNRQKLCGALLLILSAAALVLGLTAFTIQEAEAAPALLLFAMGMGLLVCPKCIMIFPDLPNVSEARRGECPSAAASVSRRQGA